MHLFFDHHFLQILFIHDSISDNCYTIIHYLPTHRIISSIHCSEPSTLFIFYSLTSDITMPVISAHWLVSFHWNGQTSENILRLRHRSLSRYMTTSQWNYNYTWNKNVKNALSLKVKWEINDKKSLYLLVKLLFYFRQVNNKEFWRFAKGYRLCVSAVDHRFTGLIYRSRI